MEDKEYIIKHAKEFGVSETELLGALNILTGDGFSIEYAKKLLREQMFKLLKKH